MLDRCRAGNWEVRSDPDLAREAIGDGWWVKTTLADNLRDIALNDPHRTVVVDGQTRLTAGQLLQRATEMAAKMRELMPPGSVVSFMLPNWYEAAIVYCATTLAGMVVNPILPSLRDHDLQFILQDANSRMIFVPEEFRGYPYAEMLDRLCQDLANPPVVVVVRGAYSGFEAYQDISLAKAKAPWPGPAADDVRMLMYTSGTTGRPKGVLHTHNTLNALMRQIGDHWLIKPGDSFLIPSPISHIGGSIYAFEAPLLLGTRAVLMDQWDAARAISVMRTEEITHMAGATPFLQQLLNAAKAANSNLPDLKVFICGGASVPPALVREATDYFAKARVCRVYGSTEVPVTTVGALETRGMIEASETDGKPGIATVKLGDSDEIRVRGPQMLVGYVHPEDELSAFDENGFFRTGDQGRMTESGALVVTGRIKDLIIRNGENIAPKEIEDLLLGHPDIAEIAIVGIPDARTGEKSVAVIVPVGSAQPSVADLAEFLSKFRIAKFKYPELVDLRDALPKNEAGKVLKHVLRSSLSNE